MRARDRDRKRAHSRLQNSKFVSVTEETESKVEKHQTYKRAKTKAKHEKRARMKRSKKKKQIELNQ